jgi:hypothetical protein
MKKHFLLIISLAALFFSCEKNSASLEAFSGNELDSVTLFRTRSAGDTFIVSTSKFSYTNNKNTISSKHCIFDTITNQYILSSEKTIDIEDKKETIVFTYANGKTETYEYEFDFNNFLRSRTITNNIDDYYYNSTFIYSANRQLYQAIHTSRRTINNELQNTKHTDTYFWENDNIKKVNCEDIDLITSIKNTYTILYKYNTKLNPLNHHYEKNYNFSYERLGKACKNLVSSIEYTDQIHQYKYEQDTVKNRIKIEQSSSLFGEISITELFYTDN